MKLCTHICSVTLPVLYKHHYYQTNESVFFLEGRMNLENWRSNREKGGHFLNFWEIEEFDEDWKGEHLVGMVMGRSHFQLGALIKQLYQWFVFLLVNIALHMPCHKKSKDFPASQADWRSLLPHPKAKALLSGPEEVQKSKMLDKSPNSNFSERIWGEFHTRNYLSKLGSIVRDE